MKLSSTNFTVNHCHYLMLSNKRQNWWPWAKFSFRPATHDHRAFCCFRYESEEFGYFVGGQEDGVTLFISPQTPPLIIISNSTALTVTNPAWLWKCLSLQYLLIVTCEISHCPVKSRDSKRAGLHLTLLSITCPIPYRAQNITKYSDCIQGYKIS